MLAPTLATGNRGPLSSGVARTSSPGVRRSGRELVQAWHGLGHVAWPPPAAGNLQQDTLAFVEHTPAVVAGRPAQALNPTGPAPDFEQLVEARYHLVPPEQVSLGPDPQDIRHPGGTAAIRDALVVLHRCHATI